ncbi:MAG: M48 family metallopeptidase [Inconstantimicrobium porci]|uniref:M48 family metallopeptidase n=1 Tax=Inconstantimicrobium porci TaxID=2652291 RepID=UPI00240A50D4|nr:M48 family metallopeptidase [Inconstantimicrobium porci]MDD6771847.1 M48 family metallopeptidase [Inconstantimicrobium porci]MDY5913334.1 M48 family metallopeptidase [Inconstantimicrobium porci]
MKKFILKSLVMLLWICMVLIIGTGIIEKKESPNIKSTREIEIKIDKGNVKVPEPSKPATANYKFSVFYIAVKTILYFIIPFSFLYFKVPQLIIKKENSIFQMIKIFLIYSFYEFVMYLPLYFFSGFYRNKLFESSSNTINNWLSKNLIYFTFSLAVSVVIFMIIYTVYKKSKLYILLISIMMLCLNLTESYIGPVVIDPMFNNFSKIEDKNLTVKINMLCQKAGVGNVNVLKVDKSKDTNFLNAYMTGIGKNKRIVIYDNTLKQLSTDEILSVAAHEIGHYKMNHVVIGMALSTLELFITLFAVDLIIKHINVKKKLNKDYKSDKLIPLFFIAMVCIQFLWMPIDNACSRYMERKADEFAISVTGNKTCAAVLQCKLMEKNMGTADVNGFIKLWYADHPTSRERIEAANRYGK